MDFNKFFIRADRSHHGGEKVVRFGEILSGVYE